MKTARKFSPLILVLAVLVGVVTAFWAPTLFGGKTLVHGDSLLHGLSLWRYNVANVGSPENLVWDKYTYGGHPLFAEGQGGFAFPLHMLLARISTPEFAHDFAHWIEMILAGIAVIGLGRLLKLSYWACGFAGLATVFSSYWIQMQQNMTISAAAMCIPWILWAAEYWLQRRSWLSAVFLGGAVAVGVLAGYPHCLHGAIVYIGASMLVHCWPKRARIESRQKLLMTLQTGLLAVVIAIGLSSIQLLPLLELTQYSHRSAGTVAAFIDEPLPFSAYLRGLIYTLQFHEMDLPDFVQVMGSVLVCGLFSISIFFRLDTRIKGHAIAALLLLNLGMAGTSPLAKLIYDYHLIPGMHFFRHMMPYFLVANIGISLVAASSIDNLVRALQQARPPGFASAISWAGAHRLGLALFTLAWAIIFYLAGFDMPVSLKNVAIALMALCGVVLLSRLRRPKAIPILILSLLVAEIFAMKLHEFHFGDKAVLDEPATVARIASDPHSRDFKFYSASFSFAYSMGSPSQSQIEQKARTMLANLCGLSNLGWRIPSMMGALALPLRERVLLDPVLEEEVKGNSKTPAGMRMIDLLGVRYISADEPLRGAAFDRTFRDPETGAWLIENSAAHPRFQTYANHVFVDTSEEALEILRSADEPVLTLEVPPFADRKLMAESPATAPAAVRPQIEYELLIDEPTHYRLNVKAEQPGWIFLADANYPGWRAYVDGAETMIYTAQILGKAVAIPEGEHQVELTFQSSSYRIGLLITQATLLAIAVAAIVVAARRRRRTVHES